MKKWLTRSGFKYCSLSMGIQDATHSVTEEVLIGTYLEILIGTYLGLNRNLNFFLTYLEKNTSMRNDLKIRIKLFI